MSIFEMVMLICFGSAWPFSIYKTYTSRTNSGKSMVFLYIVLLGYTAGIIHKLLYSRDVVIYFYIINFMMVLVDVLLSHRNLSFAAAVPRSGQGLEERV